MTVTQLLAQAFSVARGRLPEVQKAWVAASHRMGGLLPNSLLAPSIYKLGDLDLVLRCMEDERASADLDAKESDRLLIMLSEQWVGSAYAVAWVLKEREPSVRDWEGFNAFYRDLWLLRIPLEKYEIAADKKLPPELPMQKVPPNEDASDSYIYAKDDPKRAHIMPRSLSQRGSLVWLAVAGPTEQRWLERRELSDRALGVWT